jgi:hypothetical protein
VETAALAEAIKQFNPDAGWKKAGAEERQR